MLLKNVFSRASFLVLTKASVNRCTGALSRHPSFIPSINISVQRFLSDIRFSEKHEWIRLDATDKTVGTVGISEYAQEALGDVVYVQGPEIGSEVGKDDEVGAVESVKAANEIYTPVSGTILELNAALEDKPGLVNSSCYEEGWLFKIKVKDQAEVDSLMDEKAYAAFVKSVQE